MKRRIIRLYLGCALGLLALGKAGATDDFFEAVSQHLTFNAPQLETSVRISGLLDLEGYYLQKPAPGLIQTEDGFLLNPRLTVFADAQMGKKFYFFAQARVDRGFDPTKQGAQVRLDEYALRFSPLADGVLNVQIGKFATIVGNWANRHDSWENPFITAPSPYENLTAIWDSAAADTAETLLDWSYPEADRYLRNPVVWGPSYTSGLAVSGRIGNWDYAVEIKNTPLSSRPEAWDVTSVGFAHPTYSGRIGWRPNEAWNLGLSASTGAYLLPEAEPSLAPGTGLDDYRQTVLAHDVSFAWHHWQIWGEVFATRFEIPQVGNADTLAWYVEAKYKFTPQIFGALRWNQQWYNEFAGEPGGEKFPWTSNLWKIDAALTWRLTPNIQSKIQYSFLCEEGMTDAWQSFAAGQFTIRF